MADISDTIKSFRAGENLTGLQYRVVYRNSDGEILKATDATLSEGQDVIGVLQQAGTEDELLPVQCHGFSKGVAGDTLTAGSHRLLSFDANGKFIPVSSGEGACAIWLDKGDNKADGDIIEVMFFGVVDSGYSHPAAITDPGDAGAIPVTRSGVCAMTSAGAETRTLAIPSFIGQQLILTHDTDGGSIAVTAAAAINEANNTVMTFTDASETAFLVGVTVGGALVWSIQGNDGVTLS